MREQSQHVHLALGQSYPSGHLAVPGHPPHGRKVWNRTHFTKLGVRRLTMQPGRLPIAQPMADVGKSCLRTGRLVGHTEPLPRGQRRFERVEGVIQPVSGRQNGAGRPARRPCKQRHLKGTHACGEFFDGCNSGVSLAGGQKNFHRWTKKFEPIGFADKFGRSVARPAGGSYGGDRSLCLSASQPKKRIARLWIDAVADRLLITAAGQVELAKEPVQLALLVMRLSNRRFRFASQPVARSLGLFHCARPVALHL